ncbi:TonB-dependent siderophore receptor [Falsirhodobacter sp. alg1]|uniref:TonB-dependent siderophore receptor n=1 Tax=Falsirhodobacter sp. alg1 TaxID=1472418 RepID=UPI0005EECC37|nr:TonB-dependent siderophore receptor [Falsirhodobacter sp. alg1]
MKNTVGLLAIMTGIATQASAQDIVLDPIFVEAESDSTLVQDGYVATEGRQATKVDTPILNIPQAITTITQDQLEDQKPRTVNEALTYTASANTGSFGLDTRYDAFYLRGFPTYYTGIYRDGLRVFNAPSAIVNNDPYTVEGIAILKGPASSLYGVSGPGGLVNFVSKRPKDETFREIELLGGTDDRQQLSFDFTGPLNNDGTLLYRITGLARDAESPLPGFDDDKTLIAPSLTWKINDRTTLTVLGEYSDIESGATSFFFNEGESVDFSDYFADPDYNSYDQEQWRLGYELEHELTNNITLRQNLRYTEVDADLAYSYLTYSTWGHYVETSEFFTVDNQAQFDFNTGTVSHQLLVGVDYGNGSYDSSSAVSYESAAAASATDLTNAGNQDFEQWGVYIHDQMVFGKWTAFASARYDWLDSTTENSSGVIYQNNDEAASGRIGLSYQMDNGITPYANLSTSFSPNVGVVYADVSDENSDSAAKPTTAVQQEAGVKYQLPNTNSLLSAAVFNIDQTDGVILDSSAGPNRQRQLDMNSRGIELEASTSFDNGLSLIASYTHLRVEIEEGVDGTVGNEVSSTPNNIASVWTHYAPQQGALEGFGFGAGLRYVGSSYTTDYNTSRNADRTFVDLALSYDFGAANASWRGVEAQLNVRNVFDVQKAVCTSGTCYLDDGRSATASIRYRF